MGFARTLRTVSEKQLMVAAEAKIARKYGTTPPLPPKGIDGRASSGSSAAAPSSPRQWIAASTGRRLAIVISA